MWLLIKYSLLVVMQCWCAVGTNLLVATGDDSCWIAALQYLRWTLSGSLMTNCWSFIIAVTKKRPKRSLSHTCEDSLIFIPSSKTRHQHTSLARCLSFGLPDACFYARLLLSADTMSIFHQWTRKSSPSKQSSNWQQHLRQASLYSWYIMRYITSSKKYLTISHILLKYFELVFLWLQPVKIFM